MLTRVDWSGYYVSGKKIVVEGGKRKGTESQLIGILLRDRSIHHKNLIHEHGV